MQMGTNTIHPGFVLDTMGKGVLTTDATKTKMELELRQENFVEGDIVLISDSNAPHRSWLTARVLEMDPGQEDWFDLYL